MIKNKIKPEKKYYSINELSLVLGLTNQAIRYRINDKRSKLPINVITVAEKFVIHCSEVKRLLKEQTSKGKK